MPRVIECKTLAGIVRVDQFVHHDGRRIGRVDVAAEVPADIAELAAARDMRKPPLVFCAGEPVGVVESIKSPRAGRVAVRLGINLAIARGAEVYSLLDQEALDGLALTFERKGGPGTGHALAGVTVETMTASDRALAEMLIELRNAARDVRAMTAA